MRKGLFYLNEGNIYNNKINNINGLSSSNHSDILLIENGQIFIDKAKFEGSIFKSDLSTIKLKSPLLIYEDTSKIYIELINNGNNKTILTGDNYIITSDDLSKLNIIDVNSGELEVNSNSIIFIPKLFSVSFNFGFKTSLISFIEEDENDEEIYYYGKEIILSKELFSSKENEYINRIYDQKGNNYIIDQKVNIVEDIQFFYEIAYKNEIILDFVDYKENILLKPDESIYLPSYRKDFSIKKNILKWQDIGNNEIFEKSQKIQGNKNRTIIAIYDYKYYSAKFLLFDIEIVYNLLKYEEIINFPEVNLPKGNHIKWIEKLTNQTYNETFVVKKDCSFSLIFVSYVKYISNEKLIEEKEYIVNSTFTLLTKDNNTKNKILYWLDKETNNKYYYGKDYIIAKDLELYSVFEKKEKNNNAAKAIIIIIIILFTFIGVLFIYRYIRRKQINKIDIMPHDSPLTPVN